MDLTNEDSAITCQLVDASAQGLCILTPHTVPPGHIVRIDFSEGTVFGQVVHSMNDGTQFRTGVEVFDILLGSSSLAQLLSQVLGKRRLVGSVDSPAMVL